MVKKLLLFTFSALFLFWIGCSRPSTLNVGVIGPMQMDEGQLLLDSVQLAADEINAQGGIRGRKIVLFPVDDENKTDIALRNLRQTIQNSKLNLLVGGFSSGVTLQLMELMAEHKLIWLGTGGAHPDVITKIKDHYERYKYYFRVGTVDAEQQSQAMVRFADDVYRKKYGLKNFAVFGPDLIWARYVLGRSKENLLKKGFKLTYENYFPLKTIDFKNYFQEIEHTATEFVLSISLSNEGINFMKDYQKHKVPYPLLGTHTVSMRKDWCKKTEGSCVINVSYWFVGRHKAFSEKAEDFFKKFYARFDEHPGMLSWPGYDTLFLYKNAVEQVKGFEENKIIPALEKMEYLGNLRYKFTPDHDLTYGYQNGKKYSEIYFFQWKNDGQLHLIWPEKEASRPYELPEWIRLTP